MVLWLIPPFKAIILDMEKEFRVLLSEIKSYNPEADLGKIKRAWEFAKLAHSGQKRRSGEAFIYHPLAVAETLVGWKVDVTTIIAGLLHDSVEDGGATDQDLIDNFGQEVALLVAGVTKISSLRLKDKVAQPGARQEEFAENLRKMLLVMAKDLRVVLVKLADRIHNMETLAAIPRDRQVENARETLEVYAPLAERLGIGKIKGYLEDLAFAYLFPEDYRKLLSASKPFYKKAQRVIKKMKRSILTRLAGEGIPAQIAGREKHLYSLWRKLQRPEIAGDFDRIHDIVALRVVVKKIADCYGALGIIHGAFKPVPHIGISDFIAQPKPNGYQSIHTKVFGPDGRIVEVQVRTQKMQEEAEFGFAAHWAYADAKGRGAKDQVLEKAGSVISGNKLAWVRQLLDWQREIKDSDEYLAAVKFDALAQRNFVFSPRGDVFDLPVGATPVDFAFSVHTDLGKYIRGAKVDGKVVPLDYRLKSGQVVEILKTKNPKAPSRGWLDFVVTTLARREISKHLREGV